MIQSHNHILTSSSTPVFWVEMTLSSSTTMEKELWDASSQGLWWQTWSQKAQVHPRLIEETHLRKVLPLVGMDSTVPK